jgi:hypothetical protein
MCQVLCKTIKSLKLLNITGGGSNAKSTILQFLQATLGDVNASGYAYKMSMDYLTNARYNSSAAQPELMPIQFARFVLLSEPSTSARLNDNKFKTILSGESIAGRSLYGNEINFIPTSIFICGSNPPLRFDDGGASNHKYTYDYGTTRRLDIFKAECKFTNTPDENDPLHKKADPSIEKIHIYNPQYQGGLLSILGIVFALFQMMHNEEIESVCAPNIVKETDEHLSTFDIIGTFINTQFIYCDGEIKLDNVIDAFIAWHDRDRGVGISHNRDTIRAGFQCSRLEKFIKSKEGAFIVVGCRPVAIGEAVQPDVRFRRADAFDFKSYEDYIVPRGQKLPFDGQLKRTNSAADFLQQLGMLYKTELAKYKSQPIDQCDPFGSQENVSR